MASNWMNWRTKTDPTKPREKNVSDINNLWVLRQTDDSIRRNTTAHTDHSKVREEFRQSRRPTLPILLTFLCTCGNSNGSGRSSRSNSRSSGKVGGRQFGGMTTHLPAHGRAGPRHNFEVMFSLTSRRATLSTERPVAVEHFDV